MTLSEISIKRPVFAWILMFGLIFFGALSFQEMGINENPDVEYPVVTISYGYEGASPVVIEKDVIEPVESVLVSMEGIKRMTSTAERGGARIKLEFNLDQDIDFALQEAQTLLGRAQRNLPDILEPPVVTKSNAADNPIMYLALRNETLTSRELMVLFRDRIVDSFATIEGVAEVRPFGYHEPMMRIDLDAKTLQRYQLTAQDIVDSIRREHKELPAGKFEYKDDEDLIRIMGEVEEVKEFERMIISRRGGSPNFVPLRLKDVADVYEGTENIQRINRINGESGLSMAIQKQRGVNAVATADKVKVKIKELNQILPEGVKLEINFDTTQFIRETVNELIFTLILSALLTSIVCWIFLGSWTATLNILLAIPTAIIGTFIVINQLGFTLNSFSLLGLALAIGVVVDDAVIMLENIVRYMQKGYTRLNAAFKGSREITLAVVATTLALVSIFIPITFMEGIEGRFFLEFALTISIAVALSSLEALTLAPMRCSQFLKLEKRATKVGKSFDATMQWLTVSYKKTLQGLLRHRVKSVSVAIIFFILSLGVLKYLPTEFVPPQDRGVLFVMFIAPDGRSMEYTNKKVQEFEKFTLQHPDVKRANFAIGGYGQGGQGNRGNGFIMLNDRDKRERSQFEVADELRKKAANIKGIRTIIRDRTGSPIGGGRGSPVEFIISGPEPEKQKEYFYQIRDEMKKSGLMVGIRSDDVRTLPEVQIVPDREKAIRSGVEVAEIANIINATFGGVVAGEYTDIGRRFEIFVQLKEENRQKIEDIKPILVRNNRGELIPLMSVVDIVKTATPQYVYRENRVRGVRVDANLAKGVPLGKAVNKVKEIANNVLPEKYYVRFDETPQDKVIEIVFIMVLGLVMAYMVLASQFNSFLDPFIIFLAIPFGLTGSFMALVLGGQSLNIYSIIGILLTMGIVKKNSILLIEFTNQLRDSGKGLDEALIEACPTRLRPILMTTFATLAASLPPALALGPGSETRVPMAYTVLGGVSLSMFFTLFVVPCVFSLCAAKRRGTPEESED